MIKCKEFTSSPDFGQLAVDGEWETATVLKPGDFCGLAQAKEYLGNRTEMAFEAFFNGAYFGIRHAGNPADLAQLIVQYASALHVSKDGHEFFNAIPSARIVHLSELFAFSEIGAVNAWGSVSPYRILDPTACLSKFQATWKTMGGTPVCKNITYKKAIEFVFENGDGTHWFAFPVSSSTPPFALEKEKLMKALKTYSAFRTGRCNNSLHRIKR